MQSTGTARPIYHRTAKTDDNLDLSQKNSTLMKWSRSDSPKAIIGMKAKNLFPIFWACRSGGSSWVSQLIYAPSPTAIPYDRHIATVGLD